LKDRNDRGREVVIGFDSDVMVKPQVHAALVRLAAFLKSRGARVSYLYLPYGDGAAKVGLDDYIAQGHGVDDLMALVSTELRQPVAEDDDGDEEEGLAPYRQTARGLVWDKKTNEGTTPVRLTNFTARIIGDEEEDDGV